MSPRVLIVDDQENNRCVLMDALEDEALTLEEAADGPEALQCVQTSAPDLILLDILMPGMNGIEVCRHLKSDASTSGIPIILVTALGEDGHVIDGLNAGATDYIAKPFAGPVVRARVRAALRSKLAHDEVARNNQEIAALNRVIEQKNQRLTVLTETAHRFVDNVAHEFRTPLSIIKEFAAIIEEGLSGPVTEAQREHLAFIEGAVRELSRMVDDFLDSSKLKARTLRVDRRAHDIDALTGAVLPVLQARAAAKRITVKLDIASDLPPFFADLDKASRTLVNLGVNAIKFSFEDDTVTIRAARHDTGGVRIEVADNGPGMTEEETALIFERFRQVGEVSRGSVKGFGLGLNIARELAWLNLGTLSVRSTLGEGSTFAFTVPPVHPAPIVAAYLERLGEHEEQPVQLVLLRATPADANVGAVRRFLVANCYPMDLVLGTPHDALVVGVTTEPQRWQQRLQALAADRSRQRTGANAIPSIEIIAQWPYAEAEALSAALLDAFVGLRAVA